MKTLTLTLACLAVLGLCRGGVIVEEFEIEEKLEEITSKPQPFNWTDCGGNGGHVEYLTVSPDPIKLPGNVTFSIRAVANVTLAAPLKTQLTIDKKIFRHYVKVPCIDNFGSCTYDDLCSMLPSGPCPPVLVKNVIPCHCPIKPGMYTLPPIIEMAPKVPLLPKGDYRIKAQLYDTEGNSFACLQIMLSILSD